MYDRILDARLIAYHLWPYHFITSISLSPACSTLLAVSLVWLEVEVNYTVKEHWGGFVRRCSWLCVASCY